MSGRILLINPNSNEEVTGHIDEAAEPLRIPGGPVIESRTLESGPIGIETQEHVEAVTLPTRDIVVNRPDVDAFVLACFSDPGLAVCREATKAAVLGIRECAVFSALSVADRFGVVALGPSSVRRQAKAFREMGVSSRWAGSEPLYMTVAEAEEDAAFEAVEEAAEELMDRGADAIILGCAGMVKHVAPLQSRLAIPVIEPVQAATGQAVALTLIAKANAQTTIIPTQVSASPGSSERLRRRGSARRQRN